MIRKLILLAVSILLFFGLLSAAGSRRQAQSGGNLDEQLSTLEELLRGKSVKGEKPKQFLHFGLLGLDQKAIPPVPAATAKRIRDLAEIIGVDVDATRRNRLVFLPEPLSPHVDAAGFEKLASGWASSPDRVRAVGYSADDRQAVTPTNELVRLSLERRGTRAEELGVKSLEELLGKEVQQDSKLWHAQQLARWEANQAMVVAPAEKVFGAEIQVGARPMVSVDANLYSRGLLPFRRGWQTLPWQVDRTLEVPDVSPQAQGLLWAVARSAGRFAERPWLASLVVDSKIQTPASLRRAYYQALGHGAKMFRFEGAQLPAQAANGEPGLSPDQAALWTTLKELIHETGLIERVVFDLPPRPADIAFLVSAAEETRGRPLDVAAEMKALYVATRQAGYAVDVLCDDDLMRGRHEKYKAIFLVGSHLERRTASILRQWANGGGVLAGYAGGGMFDEYGLPLDTLHEVYGISEPKFEHPGNLGRAKADLPQLKPLDVIAMSPEGVKKQVPVLAAKQTFKANARTEVFGRYQDGGPAAVRNVYGKGLGFLYGGYVGSGWCQAVLPKRPWRPSNSSLETNHFIPTAFDHDLGDQITAGSDEAVFHLITDNLAVETLLLEGPKGLAVVCINWSMVPQDVFLTVQLAAPDFTKAASLARGPLKMDKLRDFKNPRAVTYNFRLKVDVTDVVMIE